MDCLFELISGFIHLAIKTFTKTAAGEIKKKKKALKFAALVIGYFTVYL